MLMSGPAYVRKHQAAPQTAPGQTGAHREGAKDTIAPCPRP